MSAITAALSLALASYAVSVERVPLREGCEPEERTITELRKGDPVEIRFRLAGSGGGCFKVTAQSGGRTWDGYLPAGSVSGVEEFEEGRRSAPSVNIPETLRADGAAIESAAVARGPGEPGARAARLVQANRPLEALRILEPAARSDSADAGLLSLAGYAAYRADDMRLAMDYWQRALAFGPNASVERLYRMAEREAREDQSGERLVGSRFQLRYNRRNMGAATAREIVVMLEREWSRVSQELGCRAEERIVAIVQTPEEYHKTTAAAEWSAGQYNGRIRVAAADQGRLDERTRQIFAHELTHACLAGVGDFPIWLHEGLAQKLAGETLSSREEELVRRMAAAGQLPRLDKLSQTWARMSPEHAAVAYAAALLAVELFYQHHAAVGPRNLLRNPHMLTQIQADLDRRLQTSELSRR